MALFLNDEDVRRLMPMNECVEVMEDLFKQEAQGLVENLPRKRIRLPKTNVNIMGGVVLGSNAWGLRLTNLSFIYNTESGELDAVLRPNSLAWIRTGAATGLATKYMAREDATVVGVIGTGRQAVTQLEAICAVRPISLIKAYSRTAENRSKFVAEMKELLGVDVVGVDSTEECLHGSQIVVTITNARQPVFDGALIEPGMHINAAGSNGYARQEIDEKTVLRSELIVVDDLEQAQIECGELIAAAERGSFRWRQAVELHEVVGGKVAGRPSPDAVTLFESQGIGIEDIAASAYIVKKARAQGIGVELPF